MSKSIEITCYETVKDIRPDEWMVPGSGEELFDTLEFLEVLEKAKVEDSRMFYLIARQGDRTVATAVLSIFTMSLDLFIGDAAIVRWIKRRFPGFFNLKVLFCGTPVSIGHKNLVLAEDVDPKEVLFLFEKKMIAIAKENKIRHMIAKELSDRERHTWGSTFLQLNWFEGFSIPDIKLNLHWNDYSNYLQSMRYPFRRQVIGSLKKMNGGKVVENIPSFLSKNIQILTAENIDVEEFFEKYLEVMQRAKVKLETLNQAFFENLFDTYKKEIRVFTFQGAEGEKSYFFTIHKGDTLYFLWTARFEDKDAKDNYFNLYQAMVVYAIQHDLKMLHLGQTAYYAKMRIGGVPKPRYVYYKCLRPFQHRILTALRGLIFPELKLKPLKVFKTPSHDQKEQKRSTKARDKRVSVS